MALVPTEEILWGHWRAARIGKWTAKIELIGAAAFVTPGGSA
jgi:hypothetical protein